MSVKPVDEDGYSIKLLLKKGEIYLGKINGVEFSAKFYSRMGWIIKKWEYSPKTYWFDRKKVLYTSFNFYLVKLGQEHGKVEEAYQAAWDLLVSRLETVQG
jgi:hypothetical protein